MFLTDTVIFLVQLIKQRGGGGNSSVLQYQKTGLGKSISIYFEIIIGAVSKTFIPIHVQAYC